MFSSIAFQFLLVRLEEVEDKEERECVWNVIWGNFVSMAGLHGDLRLRLVFFRASILGSLHSETLLEK